MTLVEELLAASFRPDAAKRQRRQTEANLRWRAKNPEKRLAQAARYRERNRDTINERARAKRAAARGGSA